MITHAINTPSGIGDIKRNCEFSGNKFFDRSNMRFFNSRILEKVYSAGGKDLYFITSEQYSNWSTGETYPRLYTIRKYIYKDNSIKTIGEFQQYETSTKAKKAVLEML